MTNDYTDEADAVGDALDATYQRKKITGSGNASKNVVTDANGDITTEAKYSHPSSKQCNASIPSASAVTPSADTENGNIGSNSAYAKADHTHPKSTLYAPVNHNQASTTITDMDVVQVVVTYTDNTTETLNLFKKI